MALQQTMWQRQIMENLYADNQFLQNCLNWDEYVTAGAKTVVVPQASISTGFVRNRAAFPAEPTEVADSDVEYVMNNYTTNPELIRNLTKLQMSYDKVHTRAFNMVSELKEGFALDILYAWRPETAGNIINTTGENVASGLIGSTGNRKSITYKDVTNAAKRMNKLNIPRVGRKLLLTSDMYTDLLNDPTIKDKFNTSLANLNEGILGKLAGFDVMERSSTLACTDAGVVKLPGAAVVATDSEIAIAWHPKFVGRSMSGIKVYFKEDEPTFFGDVISMEVNGGGKKAYADGKGVVGIRPANV